MWREITADFGLRSAPRSHAQIRVELQRAVAAQMGGRRVSAGASAGPGRLCVLRQRRQRDARFGTPWRLRDSLPAAADVRMQGIRKDSDANARRGVADRTVSSPKVVNVTYDDDSAPAGPARPFEPRFPGGAAPPRFRFGMLGDVGGRPGVGRHGRRTEVDLRRLPLVSVRRIRAGVPDANHDAGAALRHRDGHGRGGDWWQRPVRVARGATAPRGIVRSCSSTSG